MKHPFTHGRRRHHLVKHPRARKLPPGDLAAQPWYLRYRDPVTRRPTWKSLDTPDTTLAVARARAHLTAAAAGGDAWRQLAAATRLRSSLTLGTLAAEWLEAGCPDPLGRPRSGAHLRAADDALRLSLPWWSARIAAAVRQPDLLEYATWRRQRARHGPGDRSVDLELLTLSQLCAWAVARGQLERNPFLGRPRFCDPRAVAHTWKYQPASDEELHALVRWLWGRGLEVSAAQCLCEALTGLRSHEALELRWDAAPGRPGHISTLLDGRRILHVARAKNGTNPAIPMHPALEDFVAAWRRHTGAAPEQWFPRPTLEPRTARTRLSRHLQQAAQALGLPERTSHGLRAFFVSVQRSMGVPDSTIADLLGHRSGVDLIKRVYGEPGAVFGTGRLDWIPAPPEEPAWTLMGSSAAARVVSLAAA
jgi:integrase